MNQLVNIKVIQSPMEAEHSFEALRNNIDIREVLLNVGGALGLYEVQKLG